MGGSYSQAGCWDLLLLLCGSSASTGMILVDQSPSSVGAPGFLLPPRASVSPLCGAVCDVPCPPRRVTSVPGGLAAPGPVSHHGVAHRAADGADEAAGAAGSGAGAGAAADDDELHAAAAHARGLQPRHQHPRPLPVPSARARRGPQGTVVSPLPGRGAAHGVPDGFCPLRSSPTWRTPPPTTCRSLGTRRSRLISPKPTGTSSPPTSAPPATLPSHPRPRPPASGPATSCPPRRATALPTAPWPCSTSAPTPSGR